jgi:hypothetical protein
MHLHSHAFKLLQLHRKEIIFQELRIYIVALNDTVPSKLANGRSP